MYFSHFLKSLPSLNHISLTQLFRAQSCWTMTVTCFQHASIIKKIMEEIKKPVNRRVDHASIIISTKLNLKHLAKLLL